MANIEMKLKPWPVPDHAVVDEPPRPKQEGIRELLTIPLSDLPYGVLQEMARDWLMALYEKAGKPHNWRFD